MKDHHTGDLKSQWEQRDGDKVRGSYSLLEPDGSIRTVDYTADDLHGFNAVVKRTGPSRHPVSKHVNPSHYALEPAISVAKPVSPIASIPKLISPIKSTSYSPKLSAYPSVKQYYSPDLGGLNAYNIPGGLSSYDSQIYGAQALRAEDSTHAANPGPVLFPETPEEPQNENSNRKYLQVPAGYVNTADVAAEIDNLYHEFFSGTSGTAGRG